MNLFTNLRVANGHRSESKRIRTKRFTSEVLQPLFQSDLASFVIGLGGQGPSLNSVPRFAPELRDHIMVADADKKLEQDCFALPHTLHLTDGGDLGTILRHKQIYKYLRNGVPDNLSGFSTAAGVGKIRCAVTVLLGHDLETVRSRIYKLLERILCKFRGPGQKRLIANIVFGMGGGSGSGLAIPFTALVLDVARAMSKSLRVVVRAHTIEPSLFLGLLSTPVDRERTLANGSMTLDELFFSQDPRNLEKLFEALDIEPLDRPLFDHIAVYDGTDSGSRVQSIEEVWERIGVNIAVSDNEPLDALVAARDINPAMAQWGTNGGALGTSVIEARHAQMIRVPVYKLAQLYAACQMNKIIALANEEPAPGQGDAIHQRCKAHLQLETALQKSIVAARCEDRYLISASSVKLSPPELRALQMRRRRDWKLQGRPDLERAAGTLAEKLQADARAAGKVYSSAVGNAVQSVPTLAASLREALAEANRRMDETQTKLEEIAVSDTRGSLRRSVTALEKTSWFSAKERADLRSAHNAAIEAECLEAALRNYRDSYLAPLVKDLKRNLEQVESVHCGLKTQCQQLDIVIPKLTDEIGFVNSYFAEIVDKESLPDILTRMSNDVPEKLGAHSPLVLTQLLQAHADSKLVGLLDTAVRQLALQAQTFFEIYTKDLQGFLEYFELDVDWTGWLSDAFQVTLPAKLDLAVCGPANFPMAVYVMGPESMRDNVKQLISDTGNPLGIEFCRGNDPFSLVVLAKISRAPFSTIPGLEEMDRAYDKFLKSAPKDHAWGELISHLSLIKAHGIRRRELPATS